MRPQTALISWSALVGLLATACGGGDGSSVPAPVPTATLKSSRYDVPDTSENVVTLEWSSTNAVSCVATGAWTGTLPTSGSKSVAVTQTSTYTVECISGRKAATASVTVQSWARPAVSLAADPAQLLPGSVTRLSWSSQNATKCTGGVWWQAASPGFAGPLPPSGSVQTVPLAETNVFGISCTNPGYESVNGSATARVVVGVGLPKFSGAIVGAFHAGDLNDVGDVVGWGGGQVGPGVTFAVTAKMLIGGVLSNLPGCPDALIAYRSCESMALDVNERRQVVGWRREYQAGFALEPTAFLYQDGLVASIPVLYEANGINSAGHVVGSVRVTQGDLESRHAALLADGRVTDLGTLGGRASAALAINDAGVVVGWADTPTGTHAFRYANGVMTDLGTLGGENSVAYGINSSGTVVGVADRADGSRRAFLVAESGMVDLGTLGGASSEARAINDAGQVVGWSETSLSDPYSTRAFVFSDGAMHDLNGYLSSPLLTGASYGRGFYLLKAARGINRSGQVVADADDGQSLSGRGSVALLTPLGP